MLPSVSGVMMGWLVAAPLVWDPYGEKAILNLRGPDLRK